MCLEFHLNLVANRDRVEGLNANIGGTLSSVTPRFNRSLVQSEQSDQTASKGV